MRFLLYTTGDSGQSSAPPAPPSQQMMDELAKLTEDTARSGVLLATGGLSPASTRVRNSAGKLTVTDGLFTETKELTGGVRIHRGEVAGRGDRVGQALQEDRR